MSNQVLNFFLIFSILSFNQPSLICDMVLNITHFFDLSNQVLNFFRFFSNPAIFSFNQPCHLSVTRRLIYTNSYSCQAHFTFFLHFSAHFNDINIFESAAQQTHAIHLRFFSATRYKQKKSQKYDFTRKQNILQSMIHNEV